MIELNKDNIICDDIDAIRYAIEELKGKKERNKMKLLNMYVGKSEENIVNYYDNLIKEEENNDIVKQEYDKLVEKFQKDMEQLAEKYNNASTGSFLLKNDMFDSGYTFVHKVTDKEFTYKELKRDELQQLHDKIEEINAQIECVEMFGDENNANYDMLQSILIEYGVINENGRLTPYTPTYVEETPKKGKKVSE